MIKRILLCTDGSDHATAGALYARTLASALSSDITILNVTDVRLLSGPFLADLSGVVGAASYEAMMPAISGFLKEKSEAILTRAREIVAEGGIEPELVANTGLPVKTILELESECDLVILGKQGEDAEMRGHLIGPNVEWIVRRSVKPCLVVPKNFRTIRMVAAAFDGSDHSRKALATALDLVTALKLPLSIVTVIPSPPEERWASEIIDEGAAIAKERGALFAKHLLHGDPTEKIVEHCAEYDVDLLVCGAYGHSRIREYLLGSTTFRLLLHSGIPVWMIR